MEQQIRNIDLVYRNAELTLVALGGCLPGVTKQRAVTLESELDIQPPGELIRAFKWASRAWTFQEGLLSERRLIFTETQVVWQCNSITCRDPEFENSDSDPGTMPIPEHPSTYSYKNTTEIYWSLLYSVEEYSRRKLTYDVDALNAFSSVMRYYQDVTRTCDDATRGIMAINGIPYIPTIERSEQAQGYLETSLPYVLGWANKHSCWESPSLRPRRRHVFPSWSWAGWDGEVTFGWQTALPPNVFTATMDTVKVERICTTEDNESSAGDELENDEISGDSSRPYLLSFRAAVTPGKLVNLHFGDNGTFKFTMCDFLAVISLSQGAETPVDFLKKLQRLDIELVVLRSTNSGHSSPFTVCLALSGMEEYFTALE
jgi:hypothetical protein